MKVSKFYAFLVKLCKSGAFAVFFYIFCAMLLIAVPFILFQNGYGVIAIADIVSALLLIGLYLLVRQIPLQE